jgi:transposase InsO family protein
VRRRARSADPHREFHAASSWHLPALNRELRQWEQVYNTVRPHQVLGYLTPQQFLLKWQSQRKE